MRPAAIAGAMICAIVASRAAAQTGGDKGVPVVRNATRAYQALTSFQATFVQHFEDKGGDLPDAKGVLYQEGKTHFAMRFTDPPKDALVADGNHFWMYLPSSSAGKVLRFAQQNHPTYGTNLLGTFLDDAVDRYRITYVSTEVIDGHVTDAVLMEPLNPGEMPFRRATIWFDRDLSLPRRLDIQEPGDHHRILNLTQLQINRVIAPDMFTCDRFPKGTRIVDQ